MEFKHFCLFLLLFATALSCIDDKVKNIAQYEYLVYLPSEYDQNVQKEWPLIIFLHGASLRGDSLEKINKYGIPKLISEGMEFDFIIVSPQCPLYKDWSTDLWFPSTFENIKQKFKIDTNRIYLTGLSMGGEGTWFISEAYPEIFAAIAPVCGRTSHISSIRREVEKITHLPTWIFHGTNDRVYSVNESDKMYELLKESNLKLKYTRYSDFGHWAAHDSTYKNKELYEWFLKYKKI